MHHVFFRLVVIGLGLATASVRAASPVLTPHLPAANHTGGAVVIVSPADATPLAHWLNARGLAVFTLPPTATTADTVLALQQLRARAADYKVSPTRIAVLGLGRGADTAADTAYHQAPDARPALLGLIWGGRLPSDAATKLPPTFLVASSATSAPGETDLVALWTKLRATRTPVDIHLFPSAEPPAAEAWQELFFNWARLGGLLTDAPRLPLKGTVSLDGRELPHGYVIFTPLDSVGTGPIVGRVLNSTPNEPLGQFTVAADQGPLAGRYKVEVRQNMNRWLSNSFSGGLVQTRGAAPTPEQAHFGHHRVLTPSIADQRTFTKRRPTDAQDYIIEFKPGAEANLDLKIEIFSANPFVGRAAETEATGGLIGGPKNPGQAAYIAQLRNAPPGPVAGIPEPILLWPQGAPDAVPDANGVFTDEDKPALYAFPAPAANNTGAAFLIIPGGGFTNRCMDNEGVQVAQFLNRHGISGFVLRYRIGPNYPSREISTKDGQRGQRYVRLHAARFGVAPDRIGVIGFSAGGSLIADAFYNNLGEANPSSADPVERVSARANFAVMIYGGRNLTNAAAAPPTFLFSTVEDGGGLNSVNTALTALRGAGIPVETHVNQVGPHGTALSPGDPQLGQWPDLMVNWLRAGGFLGSKAHSSAAPLRANARSTP